MLYRYSAHLMFVCVLLLCALGFVMLSSTVAVSTTNSQGSGMFAPILKMQALWLTLGLVVLLITAFTPVDFILRLTWPVFLVCVAMLVLCYVDGVGKSIKGARRWIELAGLTLQPSELAKFSVILLLGWWYQNYLRKTKTLIFGFLLPTTLTLLPMLLVLFQKDVGTAALIFATSFVVMFVAGVKKRYLATLFLVVVVGFAGLVLRDPVRAKRLTSHFQKENPQVLLEAGYQQRQSIIALGSGGIEGVGLERSLQKQFYLPEAHTDFIFAIIGEELGLRFTLLVVACYCLIAVCGMTIANLSTRNAHALVAVGIVTCLCLQAFTNIAVVTAILPNKGLPLPFISYGGSHLVVALGMVGVLISVSRSSTQARGEDMHTRVARYYLNNESKATA